MADHNNGKDIQLDFCLATEEDFQGVVAISGDVYRGWDYLPSRYHSWLQDTNRRTFVLKRKEQVIALESVLLVDDGSTAVVEGLRVAPWERGRGIVGLIQNFVEDFLKTEFPAVKVIRLTRREDPSPGMLSQYRVVHSKAALTLTLKSGEVQDLIHTLMSTMEKEGECFEPPVTLEAKDVLRVYQNEVIIAKLLPARMLIQNWLPVYPKRSNLDYLLTKALTWMADRAEDPNFLSLGTPPIRVPLEENCHRFEVDLFGTDPRSAKIHLLSHLLQVSEIFEGGVLGIIVCMEKPLFSPMDSFCKDFKRFALMKEQLLMEKDI
ncbi:histidine N-acetyltransferase-like [Ambystoma mexicanum]|uniref:histidine N-acetyltransferase-like n=1 Tax=Ambystoma mexicanum TaxID=8296 RepID=UPI0037E868C5